MARSLYEILRCSFYKVRNNFKNLSQKTAMRSFNVFDYAIIVSIHPRLQTHATRMYGTKEDNAD